MSSISLMTINYTKLSNLQTLELSIFQTVELSNLQIFKLSTYTAPVDLRTGQLFQLL